MCLSEVKPTDIPQIVGCVGSSTIDFNVDGAGCNALKIVGIFRLCMYLTLPCSCMFFPDSDLAKL